MKRNFLVAGALLAAVAVICGAFGAHFLKTKLTAESLQTFKTGVDYHRDHAYALIAVGILYLKYPWKLLQWAGYLFLAGIILFSGSLYVLCALPSMKWVGAVTPVGGLCFITGWILLAIAAAKNIKNSRSPGEG